MAEMLARPLDELGDLRRGCREDRFAFRGCAPLGEDHEDHGAPARQLDIGGVVAPVAGHGIVGPAGVTRLRPDPRAGGSPAAK